MEDREPRAGDCILAPYERPFTVQRVEGDAVEGKEQNWPHSRARFERSQLRDGGSPYYMADGDRLWITDDEPVADEAEGTFTRNTEPNPHRSMSDRLSSMARFDQSEDDAEGWESRLEPLAAVYRKAEGKIEDALLSFETEHLQQLHVDAHQPTRQSGWAVYFIAGRIRGMTRKILRDRGADVPDAEPAEPDVRAKAAALVERLEEVHDDERFRRVWQTAQNMNGQYEGPKYESELNDLKAALAAS